MRAHCPSRRSNSAQGFTLIELLVVIAIIALLIAILLPSLSAAKQEGQKAKCLTNLKSVASSAIAYSVDDETGKIIPEHPLVFVPGTAALGFFEYGGNDGKPGTIWGANGEVGGAGRRPLNKYTAVYKDLGGTTQVNDASGFALYQCPQDQGFVATPATPLSDWTDDLSENNTAFGFFGASYTANVAYWNYGTHTTSRSPFLRPASRVPNSGNTLLFFESRMWETPWNSKATPFGAGAQAVSIRGWHGKMGLFNIAMCDGSSRVVSAKAEDYFSPPNTTAGQRQMRARDFQFDTMPSEEIKLERNIPQ